MIDYAMPFFFVLLGLESKSINMLGAVSAFLMAYVLLLMQSVYWLIIILLFFVIGSIVTRYKEEYKEKNKLLQKIRGPKNVMANGGIALLMAVLGGPVGAYGFIGSIATAASDTVASEIGVLSKSKPISVITFRRVKTGENGAISTLGTGAGLAAAVIIGAASMSIILNYKMILIAAIAGTLGNLMDSYAGALIENKKIIGNSSTNLIATTSGAVFGMLAGLILM